MSAVNKISDAQILRLRAQRLCTISGIQGAHTLQVGVAYFYRGHYLYACPAGNPIEPIPFSTKKGISIIGTVVDRAPLYDVYAKGLVQEPAIAALERALFHAKEEQREQEARQKEDVAQALEQEEKREHADVRSVEYITASVGGQVHSQPVSRVGSSTMLLQMWQPDSRAKSQTSLVSFMDRLVATPGDVQQTSTFNAPTMPSLTAYAPLPTDHAYAFTPHDRGQFLAYSAPGSRFVSNNNTPYTSRPVSPIHSVGPQGLLRPIASTPRLGHLLNEAGARRDLNPLLDFSEECYTQEELDMIIKNLPHPSSKTHSRAHTPTVLRDAGNNTLYHGGADHFDAPYAPPSLATAHNSTEYGRPPSEFSTNAQPPSRNHSPTSTVSYEAPNHYLYLPGLGHTEDLRQQREVPGTPSLAPQEILQPSPLRSPTYWHRDKPLGLGRPRKASMSLNESYNATHPPLLPYHMLNLSHFNNTNTNDNDSIAACSMSPVSSHSATNGLSPQLSTRTPKCTMPFHDDTCDGVTTTNRNLTEQARAGKGFKDLYPTIICADERVMVDWDTMMREERATAGFGVE